MMFQTTQRFRQILCGLLTMINPLVFIPSVREIPEVIESWNKLPFDKYIVRMMLEPRAYKTGRDFFLESDYTHIVIAPDDMVIDYQSFMTLVEDIEEYELSNLAGVANLDQSDMSVYSCKPLGTDPTSKQNGTYYDVKTLPDGIIDVGFTGFACQFIERSLVQRLSFTGGCNNGMGCMDLQFTNEMVEMGISQFVETNTFFPHLRNMQYQKVRAWKNRGEHTDDEGYTVFVKGGEKCPDLQ